MDNFYTVIENQVMLNGAKALLYYHFDTETAALAKYFTICAAAAVSDLPYHSAHILLSNGNMLRQEIFDRRVVEE